MKIRNFEIILNDGNVIKVDFTVTGVNKFLQLIHITEVRTTNNIKIDLEDIEHVMPEIEDDINTYLEKIDSKSSTRRVKYDFIK